MAHPLLALAQQAIARQLAGQGLPPAERQAFSGAPQACFVSLHLHGRLRGCIGTLEPTQPTVEEEVWANAISAATRDPRFPPLTAAELAEVDLAIDLLSPAEPVNAPSQLDARKYGVIVSSQGRRGVLLPDLEGVDTPQQQIDICRRKAGIAPQAPITLARFTVVRLGKH